ncbi:MAG: indole-3-glycerol phosphate synthase TrpC [Sulfobacillus sp.]
MFLEEIVRSVDERVGRLLPVQSYLRQKAEAMPSGRSLCQALRQGPTRPAVIAECKHRSPSKGWLTGSYDPMAQAQYYAKAGAAAISVLTEPQFFAGSLEHLAAVRSVVPLPVLRKDFTRHEVQLYQARAAGADAVLLIVRIIEDDKRLRDLWQTAADLGLDVLVEVHSASEVDRALALEAPLIGVNNRDLDTFDTRLAFSAEMARILPGETIKISESGIKTVADVQWLAAQGFDGVLMGEALMRGTPILEALPHDPYR